MKRFIFWVLFWWLFIFIFWILIIFLYEKWFFNDKWKNKLWIIEIKENNFSWIKIKKKIKFDVNTINENNYFVCLKKWDEKYKIIFSWDIEIDKEKLIWASFYEYTNKNKKIKNILLKIVKLYFILWNKKFNWKFLNFLYEKLYYQNKYKEYFNNWKKINDIISWISDCIEREEEKIYEITKNKKISYFEKLKKLYKEKKEIEEKYNNFIKELNSLDDNFCYNDFCSNEKIKKIYNYIKLAIINDKQLNY